MLIIHNVQPGLENRVNDEQKEGKYGVYNNRILSCLDSWACMPFLLRYHYSKVSFILRSLPHKNTKKNYPSSFLWTLNSWSLC